MSRSAVSPRSSQPDRLTLDGIVDAAIALTESEGAGALSMRRLGRALGVEGMAIYYYVRGREELLRLMADRLFEPLLDGPAVTGWRDACESFAERLRAIALARPATFALVGLRPFDTPISLRAVEQLLAKLTGSGLTPGAALATYRVVASYARGYALAEAYGFTVSAADPAALDILGALPQEEFPILAGRTSELAALDPDETFKLGLRALIHGLAEPGRGK